MTTAYEVAVGLRRDMGLRAGRDYALRVSNRNGPLDAVYCAAADLMSNWLACNEDEIAERNAPLRNYGVLRSLGE